MNDIHVVDRGSREVVVFLSGSIDDSMADQLASGIEEVIRLQQLNALSHVVVDMHRVSSLTGAGVSFLKTLTDRGQKSGYEVSFTAMSGPAHRAVEQAGWGFSESSPQPPAAP